MQRGRYNDAAGGWPFRSTQCLQNIFLMLIAMHYINISLKQYSNFVTKLCGGGGFSPGISAVILFETCHK